MEKGGTELFKNHEADVICFEMNRTFTPSVDLQISQYGRRSFRQNLNEMKLSVHLEDGLL